MYLTHGVSIMAWWYYDPPHGWAYLPIASLGKLASEVSNAVNEKCNFVSVTGASVSNNVQLSYTYNNCIIPLQQAIDRIVAARHVEAQFVHPDSPYDEFTSTADLLHHGTYGSSWLIPTYISDLRPWIQIKEAIDYLTVAYVRCRNTYSGADGDKFLGFDATRSAAWDELVDYYDAGISYEGDPTPGATINCLGLHTYNEEDGHTYGFSLGVFNSTYNGTGAIYRFSPPKPGGTIIQQYLVIFDYAIAEYTGGLSILCDGVEHTVQSRSGGYLGQPWPPSSGTQFTRYAMGTSWQPMNTNFDMRHSVHTLPSSVPFSSISQNETLEIALDAHADPLNDTYALSAELQNATATLIDFSGCFSYS